MKEELRMPTGEPDKQKIKAGIIRVMQQSITPPKRPEREPQRIFKDEEKELKKKKKIVLSRVSSIPSKEEGRAGGGPWRCRSRECSKHQEPRQRRVHSTCPSLQLTLKKKTTK